MLFFFFFLNKAWRERLGWNGEFRGKGEGRAPKHFLDYLPGYLLITSSVCLKDHVDQPSNLL